MTRVSADLKIELAILIAKNVKKVGKVEIFGFSRRQTCAYPYLSSVEVFFSKFKN